MTDKQQDGDLVELLRESEISLEVLENENHPDFAMQKERLRNLLKSGRLEEKRIEAMSTLIPDANAALTSISTNAKDSQIASIEALKSEHSDAFRIIEKIVEEAESDKVREEALHTVERMSKENNKTQRKIASMNNRTYLYMAGTIVVGLLLVAGGAVAKSLVEDAL